jgi:hypothetical protein
LGSLQVQISTKISVIMTDVFRGISQILQAHVGIRVTPSLSASFPVNYSLIIPQFDTYRCHLVYEPGYVLPSLANLTEEKPCVCLNFPLAYEYRNNVENKI